MHKITVKYGEKPRSDDTRLMGYNQSEVQHKINVLLSQTTQPNNSISGLLSRRVNTEKYIQSENHIIANRGVLRWDTPIIVQRTPNVAGTPQDTIAQSKQAKALTKISSIFSALGK